MLTFARNEIVSGRGFLLVPTVFAQTPSDTPFQPVATMKQLMLDVIYPASNNVLLAINREPADDKEWAEVRRGALTLAESGNLLIMRNRAAAWVAFSGSCRSSTHQLRSKP